MGYYDFNKKRLQQPSCDYHRNISEEKEKKENM